MYYYLFILHFSKPTTKYSCGTVKLDLDFSSVIELVTFKLTYHIHCLFDAWKDIRPMARLDHSPTQTVLIGWKSNISNQSNITPQ